MDRFLVKHFSPTSQYTYVDAASPLAAAEAFTGRPLKDHPPGEVIALVQLVMGNVVTTAPFYADDARAPKAAAPPNATDPPTDQSAQRVVVAWCVEERARLQAEIDDIVTGGMIVQRLMNGRLANVTTSYLDDKRAALARLDSAIGTFGTTAAA